MRKEDQRLEKEMARLKKGGGGRSGAGFRGGASAQPTHKQLFYQRGQLRPYQVWQYPEAQQKLEENFLEPTFTI
jgi:hypothetical protein